VKLKPITLATANDFVSRHHRHNGCVVGHRFSVGLEHDGALIGVVIIGRPIARRLDDGLTAEVTRLCVMPDSPKGACSKLYAAAQKAWFAMGGKRIVTYTLKTESGASLRGAGWEQTAETGGAGWSQPSRPRRNKAISMQVKLRWEASHG
jgi:hypothetical protein